MVNLLGPGVVNLDPVISRVDRAGVNIEREDLYLLVIGDHEE